MLDIKDLYQQHVTHYADKFTKIFLNAKELQDILILADQIVEAKKSETAHKADGASEQKRFVNGLKGEAAVAKLLRLSVVNSEVGHSAEFNVPDIKGYGVGVKTVDYGNFPVIPKENTYPQIICICHPTANDVVYVCGLADVATLNKFQHDDLLLDPNLKAKGTKTGFWGFSQLKEVSLETIEPYKFNLDSGSEIIEVSRCESTELQDYVPSKENIEPYVDNLEEGGVENGKSN